MKRLSLIAVASAALAGCFNFQKALNDCKGEDGGWECPRLLPDGGTGGGGGGGGSGGSGGSGGGGGAGGGSVVLGDGGCPGTQHPVLYPDAGIGPWCWHNPLPTGQALLDVVGTDENDIVVVGNFDTVIRWNGSSWRQEEFGGIDSVREVSAVAYDALGDLYIGGGGIGGLLRRPRNGSAWETVIAAADGIRQLAARPDGGVFAAGEDGVWKSESQTRVLDTPGLAYYGVVATGPGEADFLTSVTQTLSVGDGGDGRCIVRGDGLAQFCEPRPSAVGLGTAFRFRKFWSDRAGRNHVAAEGTWSPANLSVGSVHRQVPGPDWVLVRQGVDSPSDLYAGTGVGDNASFAVGQNCRAALVDDGGGGPTMGPLPHCTDINLNGTWYSADAGKAWAVGELGVILRGDPLFPTSPTKWERIDTGPRSDFDGLVAWNGGLWAMGEDTQLFSVIERRRAFETGTPNWNGGWVASDGSLILVGEQGGIGRLLPDGGFSLVTARLPDGGNYELRDVWGSRDDDVLIAAHEALLAWKLDAGSQVRELIANEEIFKVHGDGPSGVGFAVGDAGIFSRVDRDAGWTLHQPTSRPMFGIVVAGANSAYAVGDGLAWSLAGGNWMDITAPPVSGGLVSAVVSGSRLYAVGTNGTGYYYEPSGPGAWRELRIPTPYNMQRILRFERRLFIVGVGGQVLSIPEPP